MIIQFSDKHSVGSFGKVMLYPKLPKQTLCDHPNSCGCTMIPIEDRLLDLRPGVWYVNNVPVITDHPLDSFIGDYGTYPSGTFISLVQE